MTALPQNFIKRFLNVFTLLHFDYLTQAKQELTDIVQDETGAKDINHAKPIAQLVLNWVNDTQEEQNRV